MKKTMEKIAKKSFRNVPYAGAIRVNHGMAFINNGDMSLQGLTDAPDGVYSPDGFAKGIYIPCGVDKESMYSGFELDGDAVGPFLVPVSELEYVSTAMSDEETRYYLCGILAHKDSIVATNGHILKKAVIHGADFGDDMGRIIPAQAVKAALDLAKEEKYDAVSVTLFKTKALIVVGGTVLTTKLIDGTFPPYERVIPQDRTPRGTWSDGLICKESYARIKAMRSADVISKAAPIKLCGNKMSIGDFEKPLPFDLGEYQVGFNVEYLRGMPAGEMFQEGNTNPMIIDAGHRMAVIMPMRI